MKTVALFLMLLCPVMQAVAEIYQTRDQDGNISYTDVAPKEGAAEVKLPPVNIFKAQEPLFETETGKAAEFKYQKLEIISPPNDETFLINTTNVPIEVRLLPGLNYSENHRLQILWNNQVLVQNQFSYLLSEADRGSYVIQARVLDKNDQTVIQSEPITVHIKKPFTSP